MSDYSVYVLKKGRKIVDTQVIRHKFSFWVFLLGPIYFLFYKMWKAFFCYFCIMLSLSFLDSAEIITAEFFQCISLALHLFVAVDFSYIRERHMLAKGYVFDSTGFNDPVSLLKLIAGKAI